MHAPVSQQREPVRLSPARRKAIYGVGSGLWISGLLWIVYHYFMLRKTMFGPAPNPLEHWWLALHGAFGFASLLMIGVLWPAHIVGAWRTRRHRISGSVLTAVLGWLIISGYLLYYLGSDVALSVTAILHWAVGLALPVPFFVHWLKRTKPPPKVRGSK